MTRATSREEWVEFVRLNGAWIVAIVAVAASITGITNGFALDDIRLIPDNERVHSVKEAWRFFGQKYWPPHDGDSLYRPLTILLFAVQWAIGGGSPVVFHAVSIAINAIACVALFRLLKEIVDTDTALIAAMLFAVHPVHTEAVANVVGQSELMVALLIFLATRRYIVAARSGHIRSRDIAVISALYLAGCLFKEHGIILPGVLVAAETVVGGNRGAWRERFRSAAPLLVALIVVGVGFVLLRTTVVGEFRSGGNNELLVQQPLKVRGLTMLTVVTDWVRLLVWPAQLSADYSFPRTKLVTAPTLAMLPGLIVVMAAGTAAWIMRRRRAAVTFAILWIGMTLAIPSNMFIVTGFIIAERTLYLPSAGVALLAAIAIVHAWKAAEGREPVARRAVAVAVGILLVSGIIRSSTRNPVWAGNDSLFHQTVLDVPLSSRAHWMLAAHLSASGRKHQGAEEMQIAVMLGRPNDFVLLGVAADQLSEAGMCQRAMPLYERALAIVPHNELWRSRAAVCLMRLGRLAEATNLIRLGLAHNPRSNRLGQMLALADTMSAQIASAAIGRVR
ncbi:MAG: tetratricopeptide repeat protein [Gemmatimonadaceae bacterium]